MTTELNSHDIGVKEHSSQCPVLSTLTDVESLRVLNPRASSHHSRSSEENVTERDTPQTLKNRSLYRWLKSKFWCIRPSSSLDSEPDINTPSRSPSTHDEEHIHVAEMTHLGSPAEKSKASTPKNPAVTEPINTEPAVIKTAGELLPKEAKKPPSRERQVTFSDTVKTHIKRKYVTAAELRQIRGVSSNERKITYQLVPLKDSDGLKKAISAENRGFKR